jgi:branched-chain amino acid transport system ATP-binding protein
MTTKENLEVSRKENAAAGIETVYEQFPALEEHNTRRAGNLSGGQQQMLAIARALVGDNDLLLIDEPSEGLAPQIVETVSNALKRIEQETSVFIIEQNLQLAMDISDRYYIMDNGQIVDHGATEGMTPDDVKEYLGV